MVYPSAIGKAFGLADATRRRLVIEAKVYPLGSWIPACAGMTFW